MRGSLSFAKLRKKVYSTVTLKMALLCFSFPVMLSYKRASDTDVRTDQPKAPQMNPSLLDVRFLHADNSDYGEEWSGTRLNDDYHRLYHIVSGSAQVRYDGHDCTLTEGCSYLFPPFLLSVPELPEPSKRMFQNDGSWRR